MLRPCEKLRVDLLRAQAAPKISLDVIGSGDISDRNIHVLQGTSSKDKLAMLRSHKSLKNAFRPGNQRLA